MKTKSKINYINLEEESIVNDRIFINGYNGNRLVIKLVEDELGNKFKLLFNLTTGECINEIITSLTEKNKDGIEVTLLGTSELILKELLGTDIDQLYYASKQPKQIFIANEY